jgi:large subunit ribosomal protein L24
MPRLGQSAADRAATAPAPTSAGIRKGDQVAVIAGRDKGKTGRVLSVDPRKRTVMVEHANIIKRHTRANPAKNVKGGILEKEGPIQISNVLLVCPACNKHTRLGHKVSPDGTKVRVCRRCGTTIER